MFCKCLIALSLMFPLLSSAQTEPTDQSKPAAASTASVPTNKASPVKVGTSHPRLHSMFVYVDNNDQIGSNEAKADRESARRLNARSTSLHFDTVDSNTYICYNFQCEAQRWKRQR